VRSDFDRARYTLPSGGTRICVKSHWDETASQARIASCAPIYERNRASAQRFNEAPEVDSRLGSGTVAVIAIRRRMHHAFGRLNLHRGRCCPPRLSAATSRGRRGAIRRVRPKRGERIATNEKCKRPIRSCIEVVPEASGVHQLLRAPVPFSRMRVASLANPATGTPIQVGRLAASYAIS